MSASARSMILAEEDETWASREEVLREGGSSKVECFQKKRSANLRRESSNDCKAAGGEMVQLCYVRVVRWCSCAM